MRNNQIAHMLDGQLVEDDACVCDRVEETRSSLKVSILLLCYNNYRYITQAIDSILSQDYQDIELVVSDDASDFFDSEELEQYLLASNMRSRDILLNRNNANVGTVEHCRRLLSACSGDIVLMLAADDVLAGDTVVSSVVGEFIRLGAACDAVTTQIEMWNEDLQVKQHNFLSQEDIDLLRSEDATAVFTRLARSCFIAAPGTFLRREVVVQAGFFSDNYWLIEDYPLYCRLLRSGVVFHYLDIVSARHRAGGVSQSAGGGAERSSANRRTPWLFLVDKLTVLALECFPYCGSMPAEFKDNLFATYNHTRRSLMYRLDNAQKECDEAIQKNAVLQDRMAALTLKVESAEQQSKTGKRQDDFLSEEPEGSAGVMKLSVIMPCYNVEDTLERALDSVLMQELSDEYEIIVVDDASTDRTGDIVRAYAKQYPMIKYLRNAENSGNARSFNRGLTEARGDYFCVLDGDDYYTVQDKFKKQVAFLDGDDEGEYVAVATHFIVDFGDGTVHIPNRWGKTEFTYVDILLGKHGYFHTATYMYRNIFRGNVPEYFSMPLYRGDTPRTLFHLIYSGKKVKVLDFVGSAYTYTFKGIWSSRDEKDHAQYQVNFYKEHRRFVQTEFERASIDRSIQKWEKALSLANSDMHHYPLISIERALKEVKRYANMFAFQKSEFVFREMYASEYLDTLLTTLGVVMRTSFEYLVQKTTRKDTVCIFVSALNPKGGGIFAEVVELASMYADKNVYVIQTDEGGISEEAINALEGIDYVHALTYPPECESPFTWLSEKMVELSPYRAYYYCSHADVHSQALMAAGPCENICLFSFDHGFITGLHNPNLTTIAAKRPVDYRLLSRKFAEKLCYLPAWSHGVKLEEGATYRPFCEHERLITASGAARFYKVDGIEPYCYLDIVVELLKETGGVHYHFGPIPDDVLETLHANLRDNGVPDGRFIHIAWSENIPVDLIKNHVDIFIEPFPTVSYKLTLNVLSAGVPVAAWKGAKRMSVTDFIPSDSLFWRTKNEFVQQAKALDGATLKMMSQSACRYFIENHEFETVRPAVRSNKSMPLGPLPDYADDSIRNVMDYLPLFGISEISIMQKYLEEQKQEKKKMQIEEARQREEALAEELRQKKKAQAEEARRKEEARQADRRKAAIESCDHLKNSRSFAIGYALSSGARSFKHAIKHPDKPTSVENLHKMTSEQFVDAYGSEEALKRIGKIKASHTFKFGRLVTSPGRKVKKAIKKSRH